MIRSEAIPVLAVRADPQLRGIYGLVLNPMVPGDTLAGAPVPLAILAELEFEDGSAGRVYLRTGQAYRSEQRITRVWVMCSTDGMLGVDYSTDPGDAPLAAAPPQAVADAVYQRLVVPVGTYAAGAQFGVFARPAGLDSMALLQVSGDRPYSRMVFTWGQDAVAKDQTPIAAVPGLYAQFSPLSMGTWPTMTGMGIAAVLSSAEAPLPAPDTVWLGVNSGGPAFTPVTPPVFLAMWWRAQPR